MVRALALVTAAAVLAANAPAPFAAAPLAPARLEAMRGGFTLPSGIEVALAVRSETLLNGSTLLLSEYRIDQGAPQLAVFVPRTTQGASQASAEATGVASAPAVPTLDYRDQTLVVTPAGPVLAVSLGSSNASGSDRADLMRLTLADGNAQPTAVGQVSLSGEALRQVRLQGDGLDTTHFFGSALGSLTINTASDRAIDTITSVDISLANVSPDTLGSALMRVDGLGLAATAGLATQGGF